MAKMQSGFSMVEVLVAAALLAALALGISKLTQDQLKSTKTVETRFEYNAIINDIRQILGNPDSCRATMGNLNARNTPTGINDIKRATSTGNVSRYQVNSKYGNGAVGIVSYKLDVTDTDPAIMVSDNPAVRGTTNLVIRLDMGENRTYGQRFVDRKININVQTTGAPDYKIVECTSTGELADLEDRYVNANEDDTMDGNLTITDGHSIIMASDLSLKHDIQPLNNVMKDVRKVRPVVYRWNRDNSESIGFIAQELQMIFPSMVQYGSNNYLAVDYIKMTPVLLKAVKELDDENTRLKKEHKQMQELLNQLKRDVCSKYPEMPSCKKN